MFKTTFVCLIMIFLSGCQTLCNKMYPPETTIVVKKIYPKIDNIPDSVIMKCVKPQTPIEFFPQLSSDGNSAVIERKDLMKFATSSYLNAYQCFNVMVEVKKLQETINELNKKSEEENVNTRPE